MLIIKPSAELIWMTPNALQTIEAAGRTCYKSQAKITEESAEDFVAKITRSGHHSVLEHAAASFRFICDRGVTHELVRHRVASYSQESTRYCNYTKNKFDGQIKVIEPPFRKEGSSLVWIDIVEKIEKAYLSLVELGEKPQMARSVLPNCLKTEIVMTCNFREWLHVFALRVKGTTGVPHPQIKEAIGLAQEILHEQCPTVF